MILIIVYLYYKNIRLGEFEHNSVGDKIIFCASSIYYATNIGTLKCKHINKIYIICILHFI